MQVFFISLCKFAAPLRAVAALQLGLACPGWLAGGLDSLKER